MLVTLLHRTPLAVASKAIRTCWDSGDKSDTDLSLLYADSSLTPMCGPNDRALIDRVGNKFKHASTLEHISYNFYIEGVSRALLQELARHRMASPSVKSTRYTLKELKDEAPFTFINGAAALKSRMEKYLVFTGNRDIDAISMVALENVRKLLVAGYANDVVKYSLPESYKTTIAWTVNARSLQNFLKLRSSKAALWEIRDLANHLYSTLPEDHKYLFEDCIGETNVH
jgi:thymidylate synthase (FAD)